MAEHTPIPWEYRPYHYDDWGYIRGPRDDDRPVGPIAAIARGESDKTHDEHRAARTDPYAANAAFIVKAVNCHQALIETLTAIANARKDAPDWKTLEEVRQLARVQLSCIEDQDTLASVGDAPKP